MNKTLYIVDIRFNQKNLNLNDYIDSQNLEVLTLNPYSTFLTEQIKQEYITFHNIISVEEFHKEIMIEYKKYKSVWNKNLNFLFRDIAFLITYSKYMNILDEYLKKRKKENIKIVYLTDIKKSKDGEKFNYLQNSNLFKLESIDDEIIINNKDNFVYKINKIINNYNILLNRKNIFSKIFDKYIRKKNALFYDNKNFSKTFDDIEPIKIKKYIDVNLVDNLLVNITDKLKENKSDFFYSQLFIIINNFKSVLSSKKIEFIKLQPYTYLCDNKSIIEILLSHENKILTTFTQHGSYLYEHIFLKYNEIAPANINLVLNEYTKDVFKNLGANNCKVIGSINFNYKIKESNNKYDFLYITHCSTYSHNVIYIDGKESFYSADANNIYTRHKNIIELFGTRYKDKKICIKIQPGIMLGTMLYIPLKELSKSYKNITIEFSIPIENLINKSKYIISDYFSSEFINRELHYKRDIILFNSAPLILPKETMEDMKKMFILVETIDDLENKIKNIENISKNRPRYKDIIEYYSSKNCDTKKIVNEVVVKELNARI